MRLSGLFVILMESQEEGLDTSPVLPKSETLRLAKTLKHSNETPKSITSVYLKMSQVLPKSEALKLA